jgi:membrane-bound serine protease (ClpP class)
MTAALLLFLFGIPLAMAEPATPPVAPKPAPLPAPEAPSLTKPAKPPPAPAKPGEYTGKVVVIPVGKEDLINPARFEFMSRTLKRATDEGAEAVVFDLDTPGGLAWDTITLMMQDLQKLACRSVAYVDPRAISAGALIAVACDVIYMSPVSSIGAATPVNADMQEMGKDERAKNNSAYMGMARSAARAKGHNPAVVEAMIDKDVGLKIGDEEICRQGSILTLDQNQATKEYNGKPLLAKAIVKNLAELREREGFKGEVITAEPHGFEKIALLIAQYASILILIGLAAGYIEMQHPGMMIPGIIAALAFALFFFGHFVAGSLAGYETVVVFIIGLLLLFVEFFFFPGHIIPGLVGLIMVLGALLYTMADWGSAAPPEGGGVPINFTHYAVPLRNIGIAFLGAIAIVMIAMRFLPSVGPFKQLVLHARVGGAQASIEGEAQARAAKIKVGDTGNTFSALRPYGNVNIQGEHLEAMVEGDYLPPQTPVRVVSISGGKVVVERS